MLTFLNEARIINRNTTIFFVLPPNIHTRTTASSLGSYVSLIAFSPTQTQRDDWAVINTIQRVDCTPNGMSTCPHFWTAKDVTLCFYSMWCVQVCVCYGSDLYFLGSVSLNSSIVRGFCWNDSFVSAFSSPQKRTVAKHRVFVQVHGNWSNCKWIPWERVLCRSWTEQSKWLLWTTPVWFTPGATKYRNIQMRKLYLNPTLKKQFRVTGCSACCQSSCTVPMCEPSAAQTPNDFIW